MGYRVVTVNPLRQFPLPAFGIGGLANVASLADAEGQIRGQFLKAAGLRIESANIFDVTMWGICPSADDCVARRNEAVFSAQYKLDAEEEVRRLKVRWDEGKIQPALDLHLARQERRKKHFDSACRLEGCGNPRRGSRSGAMQATKSRRPGVRPLFCGAHVWLRRSLTKEALNALHAKSANRVRLID